MGDKDDIGTSLAHVVLCFVAGRGLSRMSGRSFTHPGMHANFLIHGVLGCLHYQKDIFQTDLSFIYDLSLKASKYLALPCLMADLYSNDQNISAVHLISGVVPFVMALAGQDNPYLGNIMIACNIASLCYYSLQKDNQWGYFTAGGAVLAYFVSTAVPHKIIYPLSLAVVSYCACDMFYHVFGVSAPPPGGRAPRR